MWNTFRETKSKFLELPEFQPHFHEGDKQDDALEWAELSLVGGRKDGTVYWLWDQKREDSIWPKQQMLFAPKVMSDSCNQLREKWSERLLPLRCSPSTTSLRWLWCSPRYLSTRHASVLWLNRVNHQVRTNLPLAYIWSAPASDGPLR